MATLYITEYATVGFAQIAGINVMVPDEPPVAEQTVAIGGTSTASSTFNAKTAYIRLHTDGQIASIKIGISPVATTSNQRFASNQTEFKSVPKGQGYAVAVISNT